MTSSQIRNSFLKFFEDRGHTIVPSSPVVPFDDPTLLFTNAGMNQFKDLFLGTGRRPYSRAVDTQKCIRVSGKHNDLEEVGLDTYHHTFFEMLGNWSFGDYYKKEAIEWAWELLTKVWGLPKHRLWATVYEDDDESEQLWKKVTDISPNHVLRFGEKENFWEMGDVGPCGPCSEIHFDRTPAGNATAEMVNAGVAELMEIWNLVFIQYDRNSSGTLTPLPAKHVDTGMGFERICAVLQDKNSNYDTDIFTPLIHAIGDISKESYNGHIQSAIDPARNAGMSRFCRFTASRTAGLDSAQKRDSNEAEHETHNRQLEMDVAFRVIADHVRALTFAVGDGAMPSNEGRGYVLRRILRRAARFGRTLEMHEPFIHKLVPTLVETMAHVFPEIKEKQEHIQKVIKGEEEGFNATLDRGLEIFEDVVRKVQGSGFKVISGEDAFRLYDTFGFPLDLTEMMAREKGLDLDTERFYELMEEQRVRSREQRFELGQTEKDTAVQIVQAKERARRLGVAAIEDNFQFTGYDTLESEIEVHSVVDRLLVSYSTPFYGESGGQVGDQGTIEAGGLRVRVADTQKSGSVNIHVLEEIVDWNPRQTKAFARVNAARRLAIMRNHTATHIVHAALRKILGTHVHQAGSLVAPDHLRFDFAHFSKVSDAELADIEALVNDTIKQNITLMHHRDIPFEEAKKMGALMFFGDKYGERVNVVQFGEFSKEFCGGTHVKNTSDIRFFKFRSEGSVASGIRRIEAVTHDAALDLLKIQDKSLLDRIEYAHQQLDELESLNTELHKASNGTSEKIISDFTKYEKQLDELKQKGAASSTTNLRDQFAEQSLRARKLEELILNLGELKRSLEKELSRFRLKGAVSQLDELVQNAVQLNGIKLVTAKVPVASMDELKSMGDSLRAKLGSGVGVLAAVLDNRVALVCVVTDDLLTNGTLDAGKLVGSVAKIVGGGGAGRPHLATAGGKDVSKLDEALRQTESIVKSFLHN